MSVSRLVSYIAYVNNVRMVVGKHKHTGFTIVELLIVIVVIGILAAITIVAFNGVQNRANDTAVQSDLSSIGKKIQLFYAENGRWPQGSTDLASLDLRVSKSAYGDGLLSGGAYYNLVYCWPNAADPNFYALVAMSKSGTVIENRNGAVKPVSYTYGIGSQGVCTRAGVTIDTGSSRDWFFSAGSWQTVFVN